MDAAEAMIALGRTNDAVDYAREALGLAEAKENRPLAAQIRALIVGLEA